MWEGDGPVWWRNVVDYGAFDVDRDLLQGRSSFQEVKEPRRRALCLEVVAEPEDREIGGSDVIQAYKREPEQLQVLQRVPNEGYGWERQ